MRPGVIKRVYARVVSFARELMRLAWEASPHSLRPSPRLLPNVPGGIRRVLIVCKGNICRSPLAAAYLSARARGAYGRLEVRSAGLATTAGKGPHPLSVLVAERHGLSLKEHVTTLVTRDLVEEADLILVMDFAQRALLCTAYPASKEKVLLLGGFSSFLRKEIRDPYNGTVRDFEACYEKIKTACDRMFSAMRSGQPDSVSLLVSASKDSPVQ